MTVTEKEPPEKRADEGPSPEAPAAARRLPPDALELLAVLGFSFFPSLVMSAIALAVPQEARDVSPIWYLQYVPRMAQVVIPVLYIVHLRGRPLSSIGLSKPRWTDLPWSLLMFAAGWIAAVLCMMIAYVPMEATNRTSGPDVAKLFPAVKEWWGYAAIITASVAVGFGEEILFRGYLLTQWERLSGSKWQGVAVSSLLFGLIHTYQGLYGVCNAIGIGLCYGLGFIFLRRLWPLVLAHALTDIISLSAR